MAYQLATPDQIESLRDAVQHANAGKLRAIKFLESLRAFFASAEMASTGLTFLPSENPHELGVAICMFGSARISLEYRSEHKSLETKLVFKRQRTDAYDAVFWEPIFLISFPQEDEPYVGEGQHRRPLLVTSDLAQKLREIYWGVGMTILYGIINGPVEAPIYDV